MKLIISSISVVPVRRLIYSLSIPFRSLISYPPFFISPTLLISEICCSSPHEINSLTQVAILFISEVGNSLQAHMNGFALYLMHRFREARSTIWKHSFIDCHLQCPRQICMSICQSTKSSKGTHVENISGDKS